MLELLFEGQESNRVTFTTFFQYLETNSVHELTPEQFEKDMAIFDEDHNGQAVIEDVVRVLKTYAELDDESISKFIKVTLNSSKTDPDTKTAKLSELKLPPTFEIKKGI